MIICDECGAEIPNRMAIRQNVGGQTLEKYGIKTSRYICPECEKVRDREYSAHDHAKYDKLYHKHVMAEKRRGR